jgi:hypothetical protein
VEKDRKVRAKEKETVLNKYSFGQCRTSLQRVSWAFLENRIKKNLREREAFGDANSAETGGGRRVESEWGLFFFANTLFVDFPLVFFLVVYLVDVCGRGVACLCFAGSFAVC